MQRLNAWTIICFFLLQTVLQPLAGISGSSARAAAIPGQSAHGSYFDVTLKQSQKDLIRAYLNKVRETAVLHQKIRVVEEKILSYLQKEQVRHDVTGLSPDMKGLWENAVSAKSYLVSEDAVVIRRRLAKQTSITEPAFLAAFEQAEKTGVAPQGLMDYARNLDKLHGMEQDVYAMQEAMLFKILLLRSSVFDNVDEARANPQDSMQQPADNDRLKKLVTSYSSLLKGLETVNNTFAAQEDGYNKDAIQGLYADLDANKMLRQSLQQLLNGHLATDTPAALQQGKLLEGVIRLIEYRDDQIVEKIASLTGTGPVKTFLYSDPAWNAEPELKSLVDSHRKTAETLVAGSKDRIDHVRGLDSALERVSKRLTSLTAASRSMRQADRHGIDGMIDSASNEVDKLRALAGEILAVATDFQQHAPSEIVSSRQYSSDVVRFNTKAELLASRIDALETDLYHIGITLSLADPERYGKMAFEDAVPSGSTMMLGDETAALRNSLDRLQNSLREDVAAFKTLQQVVVNQMQRAATLYAGKEAMLDQVLQDRMLPDRNSERLNFFSNIKKLLSSRAGLTAGLHNNLQQALVELPHNTVSWVSMARGDSSFAVNMDQLASLPGLTQQFFTSLMESDDPGSVGIGMFTLAFALKTPPLLRVKDNTLDVVFVAGDATYTISGINVADPVTGARAVHDPLLEQSYIGVSLTSLKNSFTRGATELIDTANVVGGKIVDMGASAAERTVNTVVKGLETADKVAQKTAEVAGAYAEKTVNTVAKGVEAVGKFAQKTGEVVGTYGRNVLIEGFLNDDGSISWVKSASTIWGVASCAGAVAVTVGSVGLATPLVVGACAGTAATLVKAGVSTAADYGVISEKAEQYINIGVDIAAFVTSGVANIKHLRAGAWEKMTKFDKLKIFLNLKGYGKYGRLNKVQQLWRDIGGRMPMVKKMIAYANTLNGLYEFIGLNKNALKNALKVLDAVNSKHKFSCAEVGKNIPDAIKELGTEEVADFARLSDAVYDGKETVKGSGERTWTRIDDSSKLGGFHGSVYKDDKGNCVMAFEGTSGLIDGDVLNDLVNVIVPAWQQTYGLNYYIDFVNEKRSQCRSLSVTGHSLGGSIAAVVASTVGMKAITFNPDSQALLTKFIQKNSDKSDRIYNIVKGGELLHGVNNIIGRTNTLLPGKTIFVEYEYDQSLWPDSVEGHGIGPMSEYLDCLVKGESDDDGTDRGKQQRPMYPENGLALYCVQDVMQCADGTFRGRNPSASCNFYPCEFPEVPAVFDWGNGTFDTKDYKFKQYEFSLPWFRNDK